MEPTATSTQSPLPSTTAHDIRWIGGVTRPRGLFYRGKPMRVAAWIDPSGWILAAAIVDGHGPTVLKQLLEEALACTQATKRPSKLVVWPSARAAFRGHEYPPVVVERDLFLTVVIDDLADCGRLVAELPVRVGQAAAGC